MANDVVFPTNEIIPLNHLAYVEWFILLPVTPNSVNPFVQGIKSCLE